MKVVLFIQICIYYFTADCIKMLKKMVVYSAIFEVPTNINAECINIITIFKSPKEYTCILENTLISNMLKAEAVKKFGLSDYI